MASAFGSPCNYKIQGGVGDDDDHHHNDDPSLNIHMCTRYRLGKRIKYIGSLIFPCIPNVV